MDTNVNQKLNLVQKIEQVSPAQLANLPEVADRFKNIYKIMNGGDEKVSAMKYEAEKFHFMKLITDKADLQKCSKLSLYGCFLDMAVNGLSFDPAMKHAYVVSFSTNIGSKDSPKWEKRATLMISGYGELHMRQRQGQIKYADNPIIVYEGDHFQHGTKNDKVFLEHVACFPRKSEKIIACYLRIVRNDDSVDYKVLGIDEIMNFKAFSKDQNSLAWTKGLPGMVQAKTIKHAFKSYPKMRMGEFTQLQSNVIDAEHEVAIDYGLPGESNSLPEISGTYAPTMVIDPVKAVVENINDNSFVEEKPATQSKSKSFDDDNF